MPLLYDHYTILISFSAGTVFTRQNLTSKDGPHTERVKWPGTRPRDDPLYRSRPSQEQSARNNSLVVWPWHVSMDTGKVKNVSSIHSPIACKHDGRMPDSLTHCLGNLLAVSLIHSKSPIAWWACWSWSWSSSLQTNTGNVHKHWPHMWSDSLIIIGDLNCVLYMACVCGHTAKTTCPPNDGTLLGQRRRRWSNNVQSLAECFACVVTYFLMAFIKIFPRCRALGDRISREDVQSEHCYVP